VELAPSVVRTGELPKGPVDRLKEIPAGNRKSDCQWWFHEMWGAL
jgi:hypothetical protein